MAIPPDPDLAELAIKGRTSKHLRGYVVTRKTLKILINKKLA